MTDSTVHVAAAVIELDDKVLVSRRLDASHQGGKWEFPGGKLELGETASQALVRELQEELGITALEYHPLIQIHYEYPEKRVLLDVWTVSQFSGEPHGREGQTVQWLSPDQLGQYEFPPANLPIITAAQLPGQYVITPAEISDSKQRLKMLDAILPECRLLLLRLPSLDAEEYSAVASEVVGRCKESKCAVMLTSHSQEVERLGAAGLHINSHRLMQAEQRLIDKRYWLSSSCHNPQELSYAQEMGVDFMLLSPVQPTQSHPDATPLGWETFSRWVKEVNAPIFALGGLQASDLGMARENGAQGVAGIRGFWKA
jgi:8-oxo-dGTP diphosphatase